MHSCRPGPRELCTTPCHFFHHVRQPPPSGGALRAPPAAWETACAVMRASDASSLATANRLLKCLPLPVQGRRRRCVDRLLTEEEGLYSRHHHTLATHTGAAKHVLTLCVPRASLLRAQKKKPKDTDEAEEAPAEEPAPVAEAEDDESLDFSKKKKKKKPKADDEEAGDAAAADEKPAAADDDDEDLDFSSKKKKKVRTSTPLPAPLGRVSSSQSRCSGSPRPTSLAAARDDLT